LPAQDILSLCRHGCDAQRQVYRHSKALKERIELVDNPGDKTCACDYQKALRLFLEGALANKSKHLDPGDYYFDVHELVENLRDEISEDLRFRLFKFTKIGNSDAEGPSSTQVI
jgi:hypothetical protein